jgi:hypothetical protein
MPRQKVSESGQVKAVDGQKSNNFCSKMFQTSISTRLYFMFNHKLPLCSMFSDPSPPSPILISKRINSTTTFMALNANNEPTTNFVHHRVHSPMNQATTPPRRPWSTFTFNNKNFPDGKLSYESQQFGGGEKSPWKINDVTEKRQDVMARASQIVM